MTKDEALKLVRDWIAERPADRPISAGKMISIIDRVLAQPAQGPVADAFMVHLYNLGYKSGHHDTVEGRYIDILRQDMDTYHSDFVSEWLKETCNTTPQQRPWVGLTEADYSEMSAEWCDGASWAEDKLKEKNT
jgi:hypothetical protein